MSRNLRSFFGKAVVLTISFNAWGCGQQVPASSPSPRYHDSEMSYQLVKDIPPPQGYERSPAPAGSFAAWLRQIPLKKDRTVFLYDGRPKLNQDAQFAVLNVSVNDFALLPGTEAEPAHPGTETNQHHPGTAANHDHPGSVIQHDPYGAIHDLQQCADAIMRLRSEYLYARKEFSRIQFITEEGVQLNFSQWAAGKRFRLSGNKLVPYSIAGYQDDRKCFGGYLETVFSYCGTRSLEKQLSAVSPFEDMHIGDVLIKGGSPGHAMLIIDMATDKRGNKIYMLAQSYMPAQDIHIVKNYNSQDQGPWYSINDIGAASSTGSTTGTISTASMIFTPEWTFSRSQLKTWPE